MKLILAVGITSVLMVSGCATNQVPLEYTTSSGLPEVTLRNTSMEDAKTKIIRNCISAGLQIEEQGSSSIICWKKTDDVSAAIALSLVSSSSSSNNTVKLHFVLLKQNADIVVIANRYWLESQSIYGQTNQIDLTANHQYNAIYNFMVNEIQASSY